MQAKRRIKHEQCLLEKKYEPLEMQDPSAVMQQLREAEYRNSELQARLEMLETEHRLLEAKYEQERTTQVKQLEEIKAYKDTIQEIKADLCQPSRQEHDSTLQEDTLSGLKLQGIPSRTLINHSALESQRSSSRGGVKKPTKGQTGKGSKSRTINERKSSVESDETINVGQAPHLNPMLTNRSALNLTGGGDPNFSVNPPALVSQLIHAKHQLNRMKNQLKIAKQNEERVRHEMKQVLLQKVNSSESAEQQFLLEQHKR